MDFFNLFVSKKIISKFDPRNILRNSNLSTQKMSRNNLSVPFIVCSDMEPTGRGIPISVRLARHIMQQLR